MTIQNVVLWPRSYFQWDYYFQSALEVDLDDVYPTGAVLDMPKRPTWDYKLSKQELEAKEEKYFQVSLSRLLLLLWKNSSEKFVRSSNFFSQKLL